MDVSKNRGTPKWMVDNGKPYQNGWFGGTIIFGNTHINFERSYESNLFSVSKTILGVTVDGWNPAPPRMYESL